MARRYGVLWILFGLGLVAFSGCAGEKPEVTGTVTFDGAPLKEGDIKFVPDDKTIPTEGGLIKDGKYAVKLKPGKYTVQIRASREIPGEKGPMGIEPAMEQFIPENYNDKTELTANVGPNYKFDFPLKSK